VSNFIKLICLPFMVVSRHRQLKKIKKKKIINFTTQQRLIHKPSGNGPSTISCPIYHPPQTPQPSPLHRQCPVLTILTKIEFYQSSKAIQLTVYFEKVKLHYQKYSKNSKINAGHGVPVRLLSDKIDKYA
jgi:hypothetical protein